MNALLLELPVDTLALPGMLLASLAHEDKFTEQFLTPRPVGSKP
jgi:hypothetical protein